MRGPVQLYHKAELAMAATMLALALALAGCGQPNRAAPGQTAPAPSGPVTTRASVPPAPPTQPPTGPGGAAYPHRSMKHTTYGSGETEYSLFEPAEPAPQTAPVVIFLHGYSAINPRLYYGWIEHLARRGNIVIYPAYQRFTSGAEVFQPSMLQAVTAAFEELGQGSHTRPELDKVSAAGHSLGGMLTAVTAARAGQPGPGAAIPRPKAIMIVEPGDCAERCVDSGGQSLTRANFSQIDPATRMLIVVGDRDNTVGEKAARELWNFTSHIPLPNKDYIRLISDEHGSPRLVADHYFPANGTNLMALNYFGLMKLFDALQSCALYRRDCDSALGGGQPQRYMGRWSDGQAVNELVVTKNPS